MSGTVKRAKLTRSDIALWDGRTKTYERIDASGGTVSGLTAGDYVDVLQVFGTGQSRTRQTVADAVRFINANVCTLVFATGTWTIDDNLTIPANFTCYIPAGCVFSVSSGKTLTLSGRVIVEYPNAWTTGSGTVTVTEGVINSTDYPISPAESAASVTPTNYAKLETQSPRYSSAVYGATSAPDLATNKAALQSAISVANKLPGGGLVTVPSGYSYGYDFDNLTTLPDFTGCTAPIVVFDYSAGNSYAGYPTIYDGAHVRIFFHTPPTATTLTFTAALTAATSGTLTGNWTGATGVYTVTFSDTSVRAVTLTNGATSATWSSAVTATANATYQSYLHSGNTMYIRGNWNPGILISNDSNLTSAGHANRRAFDNRRAQLSFGIDGQESWKLGQGANGGESYTNEELADFVIQQAVISGDTLTVNVPFRAIRKTGAISYAGGSSVPAANHEFYVLTNQTYTGMFWNPLRTDTNVVLRNSNGATQDVSLTNDTGEFYTYFPATAKTPLRVMAQSVRIIGAFRWTRGTPTYSASITIDMLTGNSQTITVTNGTAFTINAPTNAGEGMSLLVTIKNTSGGAVGVITWDAIFKMAALTTPATANSRSIVFEYDGTNWVQISQTGVDVPN